MRNFISLIEDNLGRPLVWVRAPKSDAECLLRHEARASYGELGYGLYATETPDSVSDDDDVVLEYDINDSARILDLGEEHDMILWHASGADKHLDNPHLWKLMKRHGIDAARNGRAICFYNVDVMRFRKVYSGVIDDPLEKTKTNELDEIALGGLARCTAVTCNALLKSFGLRPITLDEVPVDSPGVLRILTAHGLAYKPFQDAAGRTVRQFVGMHGLYDWYLVTPGHAMALIQGELFDAENKGPDGRKLIAAFQITRR